MRRTNIYLTDEQCSALDDVARSSATSRAELIRRLIDRGLGSGGGDADGDAAAIEESFGALAGEEFGFERGTDARAEHLRGIAGR